MAASFWTSTHARALVTKERLLEAHAKERERGLSFDQIQQIKGFVVNYISDLAKHSSSMVRQRVVGTAVVYLRRFYVRASMAEVDPRLAAPACLYLASKAEEAQLQAKVLLHFIKKTHSSGRYHHMPPLEMKQLFDLEMALLEGLDFNLVIFSPYHDLERLLRDEPLLKEAPLSEIAPTAWGICNDSYRTDLCLLYPPYIIALGCLLLASNVKGLNIQTWLEGLDVEFNLVNDVAMELLMSCGKSLEPISAETCNRLLESLR